MQKALPLMLSLFLFVTFILSGAVLAKELFLFDSDSKKILFMGENDPEFKDLVDFSKNPILILKTDDPNKLLVIHQADDKLGQLLLFNIASGEIEDSVDIGFGPYRWVNTPDHKQFFISSKPLLVSNKYELLHYNISEKKSEIFSDLNNVVDIYLSTDGAKLFALTAGREPELITLGYSPFEIKNKLPAGQNPENLYILAADRIILINVDRNTKRQPVEGWIKLIDPLSNKIIQKQLLKPAKTYVRWFEKEQTLLVLTQETLNRGYNDLQGIKGRGQFFKVTAAGIKTNEIPLMWYDYEYFPEKDCLYILTDKQVHFIDYRSSTTGKVSTEGPNVYIWNKTVYFYYLNRLSDSNILALSCPVNGTVKLFDTDGDKLIKKGVKFGRPDKKFLRNGETKTVVTTNSDQSKFYILNMVTEDVTVYDQSFKDPRYLVPEESPLKLYQVKKPELQTILVTKKKLYKINIESDTLEPVYEFKDEVKAPYLFEDNNRIIFTSESELLVLDSVTLAVKNSFSPVKERYFFIRTE